MGFATALVAALWGFLFLDLWREGVSVLDTAERQSRELATILGVATARSMESVDLLLAMTEADLGAASPSTPADIERTLERRVRSQPQVLSLAVTDALGRPLFRSGAAADLSGLDLARLESMTIRRADAPDAHGTMENGGQKPFIGMVRRIQPVDGSFSGAIVAMIDPDEIRRLFRSVDVGPHGVIVLSRWDGVSLVGGTAKTLQPQALNPTDWIVARRPVPGFALTVFVVCSKADVLSRIWMHAFTYGLVGLLMSAAILFLTRGLLRQIEVSRAAEAALRDSKEQLQGIFDNAAALIHVKDREGRYLLVNRQYLFEFATTPEAILGKSVMDLHSPSIAEALLGHDRKVIADSAPIRYEERVIGPRGPRDYVTIKFPLFDPDGGVRAVCGISTDITETKELEATARRERDFSRMLIESLPGIVYLFDENLRFLLWNRNFETVSGYGAEEVATLSPLAFFTGAERDLVTQRIKRVFEDGWSDVEARFISKSGRGVPYYFTGRRIAIEGGWGVIGMGIDISERVAAEQALLAKSKEIERSNRELEQFAYVASHDLQEPLRMISSYLQLLQRDYAGRLDADADEFIGYTVEGVRRMRDMVRDLLEYSRIGRMGGPMVPIDPGTAVSDALANLGTSIEESGARIFAPDAFPAVVASRDDLTRLFQNLIGNAIKYAAKGRPPEIRVTAERTDDMCAFSVADNGIGIEPRYFERIFMIFQRLHEREAYSGTGIGLAIVKKIVERHGGKLWVESEPGQGSTFHFTLPAADGP
ncbi:MAG: PAS domain S-box protein [Alphaproteobacteria bacterium]|nr:PAS domain S-box protein [Alphaproteobacteria bacterium]